MIRYKISLKFRQQDCRSVLALSLQVYESLWSKPLIQESLEITMTLIHKIIVPLIHQPTRRTPTDITDSVLKLGKRFSSVLQSSCFLSPWQS